ncbi:MAG: hypothetical protein J6A52_06730 [Bacilli bacterium]|nr:hypothetical protein [Bacilli bacterium]
MKRNKVTFDDIEHDINCNDNLDSVFRESLAEALEKLNYLSDSQLNLICGTDEQHH